jgi:putative nucleotidyltransferase with HDIG domain
MMKKKLDIAPGAIRGFLRRMFNLSRFRLGPSLAGFCSFGISVLVAVANMSGGSGGVGDMRDFETGKVADRDIVVEQPVSYIDEEATRIRIEAQERLVPAVFRHAPEVDAEVLAAWSRFSDFADALAGDGVSAASSRLAVQSEYPGMFSGEALRSYFAAPDRVHFREYGSSALETVLGKGVFSLNGAGLDRYNPDVAELLTVFNGRTERERVFYVSMVTLSGAENALELAAASGDFPDSFKPVAAPLLCPFVKENVFFSGEVSGQRVAEARERVAPVIRNMEKGKRVIRKGFVITAEEMRELQALTRSIPGKDPRNVIGLVLLILLLYVLFIRLRGRMVIGRELSNSESYLLSVLVCLYIAGTALVRSFSPGIDWFPTALAMPTALVVMIPSVFISSRLALVMALAMPLSSFLIGFYDTPSFIFALVSAVAASTVLKNAQKRMDLINAGLIIAAVNAVAVIMLLLMRGAALAEYPLVLFWAALNGIVSGMLILGVLPPLEHALNAVTTFRLIELSDLNAPILRKLFTAAPGTYSHSIMVANLAEQACQDIGANALLARVGAYYHDIGKMENPGYFVENQTDHNKHDDIAPRLSATVIRSHVKLGIEKARALGLPEDVISIVAEHHGNSLIAWFYNKAAQQEEQVSSEDFAYPGTPPRSRESAVVMLADVTEAAVRTLSKPTAAKMEKFIQQLFDAKVEHGQLALSELTFRDLETIKNAFVKVLAGYYHSRIEYPKQKDEDGGKEPDEDAKAAEGESSGVDAAADTSAADAPAKGDAE